MKPISLKLKEAVLKQTDEVRQYFDISRNAYINAALTEYNRIQKRKWLSTQLCKESILLSDNSMAVLKTLNVVGHDY